MVVAWLAIVLAIALAIWFGFMMGGVMRNAPATVVLPAG
jgi:hypothetical protein